MWTINANENKLVYQYDHSLPNFIDGIIAIEIDNPRKETLEIRCTVNAFDKQRIMRELGADHKENDVVQLNVNKNDVEKHLQLLKAQLKSRSAQAVVMSLFNAFNLSVTPTPLPLAALNNIPLHENTKWCRQETAHGVVYYHSDNTEKKNALPQLIVTRDNKDLPQQLTVDFSSLASVEKRMQFENMVAIIKPEDKQVNASFPFMHFSLAGENMAFYLDKVTELLGIQAKEQSNVLTKLREDIKLKEQKLSAPGALGILPPPAAAEKPQNKNPEPAPKQSRTRRKK